jgi:feruloyl esterase
MKLFLAVFILISGIFSTPAAGQSSENKKPCIPCAQLQKLQIPDVTINKVESLPRDTMKSDVPWLPSAIVSVAFCRVKGTISKEIAFELLVPNNWNGRFLMSGNGGFAGRIQNNLYQYVNEGYALSATNTGHQAADETDASWALNNMERQLNFGKLAVHRTAVVSKSLIQTYYCSPPAYSYFIGCSRGGGQALMEAQQYPEDFNGLVAGAPAYNWTDFGAKHIRICQVNYPDPNDLKPLITADNLKLLQTLVLQQCDKLDGLGDSIINNPADCKIDFSQFPICPNDQASPACFTKAQLAAIQTIYNPLVAEGKQIYPVLPFGAEAEQFSWDLWLTGTSGFLPQSLAYRFGTSLYKYLVYNDPAWDYSKYDFSNYSRDTKYAGAFLNATSTDYSGFKKMNGKMLIYHGWNDPCFSAFSTIEHYEEALKSDQGLSSNLKLFLLPGVLHCGDGKGPDNIDWVKEIRDWVEKGKAPERLVLSKLNNGKPVMTRPVFPYPKQTVYKGSGDPNDEKNFIGR